MTLKNRLKERRAALNVNQQEMGRLCGVSRQTISLIEREALKSKIVLCPRCEKNGNIMYFYRINSTYDLKEGRFGIFEPDESCEKYCVFDNALCIVPALSYDKDGYRLGFGMGFYDRFLADYNGMKLGLCYDNCMSESFCHDGYDISVDKVFTDKDIYTINTKERK